MKFQITVILLLLFTARTFSQLPVPENILIMVGDGMGYNHIAAAGFYVGRKLVFENFPVISAMFTYPAKAGEYKNTEIAQLVHFLWSKKGSK